MKMSSTEIFHESACLPDEWNEAAANMLFLQKESLTVLENVNPCGQTYHLARSRGRSSIAVTYRHKLDLLTYGSGSFSLPVTVVGIPCSVSSSGFSLAQGSGDELFSHLHGIPGPKLILNSDSPMLPGFVSGATLPTCRLDIQWTTFQAYLADMRSHYRYKLGKARSAWSEVSVSGVEKMEFGQDLYDLYLNVYSRSRYKLEKLDIQFFRKFPSDIEQFKVGNKPIAFVQTVRNGGELVFMFVGMDYSVNRRYETYLNVLLHVIRKGIEAGCTSIDLGQTTEETKGKLGSRLVGKGLHFAHSNRMGHFILKALAPMLSYRRKVNEYHVFK